jgi:hypothetical protein
VDNPYLIWFAQPTAASAVEIKAEINLPDLAAIRFET